MAPQLLAESPEKTRQQDALRKPPPASVTLLSGGSCSTILQLQRTLGNQRVAQLIQARRLTPEGRILGLQPKLTVGSQDDQYEREADRVARQVVGMPDSATPAASQQTPLIENEASPATQRSRSLPPVASSAPLVIPLAQRKTQVTEEVEDQKDKEKDREEDKEELLLTKFLNQSAAPPLQRMTAQEEEAGSTQAASATSFGGSFEAGEEIESQVNLSKGQGSPLPDSVRAYMEPRFGTDFSQVRVHTGSNAIQMNREIGAHAFTHGSDIFFGAGSSPANLELTAHELTHVVQQTGASPLQRQKEDASIASRPQLFAHLPFTADIPESGPDLSHQEIMGGSNTGESGKTSIGTASKTGHVEHVTPIPDIRSGTGRPVEAQQNPLLLTPNSPTSAEPKKLGEPSEPAVPNAVPSATPDITGNQPPGDGSEQKTPEIIAAPAPGTLQAGSEASNTVEKPGDSASPGMGQIAAAPDSPLKPHAISQARLINNDCLQSESQVARNAAARRQQINGYFSGVRRELSGFLTKSALGMRTLVATKQSEIVAASARTLGVIQRGIASALQAAEAQSNALREEINEVIENITISVQERVGGITNQIVDVINVIPLPDLPGVAQVRNAAVNLLKSAAGVVNGAVGQGLGFIRSAFNVGMSLLGSFLRVFRQLIDQALALASSAIQRMMQLVFQALNQLLNLIVSTLESVLSGAITPLLNRLETLMSQAISNAEQQSLAQIRANKAQHLDALASAVNPAAGGGKVAPTAENNKTASMDDSIAAIREIGLNAIQNNQVIIQSFEEQTSSITVSIFQRLATTAGQIMQEIATRIAQAVEMIVNKVTQVIQSFSQLAQAVVAFIQALIQAWTSALSRIVQYVRSLAQSPVDQLVNFAQRTLSRMRDFISRLIQNFISSGGSIIGSIAEIVGDFKFTPSFLGPAPAFVGPPIQIIGGLIIILIAGVAYVLPLWVGIVLLVVVVLLLLLLLYLLYRWIFKPPPLKPPPPPPPPPCPLPINVRNGPFHQPIDEPARVGMEIAITISSSTGVDADMATIVDSEQVGLSFNHTGSFIGMPPLPSNQSGFMPGFPIPNDRHAAPRSLIIDRADNHGGNGSFDKHQLDIFMAPACGIPVPQAIPDSGYLIKRVISVGPGTQITFRTEKSPAACTVNGFATTAGPSPTQGDDVIVRP
ncbi:protein of unknown function [Nitrosospira sp. Nl5]|uniref:eCIS core domain-containing protein n=1 Tax=Nitrosospira sp. Nl5 TaxID=200120 RepID=UPI000883DB60|nr:DUF4157 domain-containing protein [Nitrosospira sp. Nl5]SCX85491.1 protein of unknown function [Nitrosospira sp. Nl5]